MQQFPTPLVTRFIECTVSPRSMGQHTWPQRNQLLNRCSLVCKLWWYIVAPFDGTERPDAIYRRVTITAKSAAFSRPWWAVLFADPNLNNRALMRVAEGCRGFMVSLDLSRCRMHYTSVRDVLRCCGNLRELTLPRLLEAAQLRGGVSEAAVELAKCAPQLQLLDMRPMEGPSDGNMYGDAFMMVCPHAADLVITISPANL